MCVHGTGAFPGTGGRLFCENLNWYKSVPERKVSSSTATLLPHNYDGAACHACSSHSLLVGTFLDQATSVLCARTTQYLATRGAGLAGVPLACLPRVSVAAQRTSLPDKPTLSIHAKPIKAAHSENMSWEVSFYWYT